MEEKILQGKKNGMLVLVITTLLYIAAGIGLVFGILADSIVLLVVTIVWLAIGWIPWLGLKVLKPQEALVLTLFGKYYGTLKDDGFYFVNPFCVGVNPAAQTKLNQSGDVNSHKKSAFNLTLGSGADAAAQISDITGGQGRIGVEGTVTISAVHASDLPGKPIVVTHHEAPFSQTLELSGESGDLLDARVTVRDVAVASQDAGDGGKTLRAEVLLGVQGTADTQEKLTVLRDAYTYQGAALTFSGRDVVIRTGQRRASAAESGKTTLLLPDGTPPVRGMLAAFATPIMTVQDSTGSRLNTEGMLEITLLYMTDENTAPVTVHQETPFRTSFAVSAAPDSILTLTADEVEATPITSDRVELRYVLRLTCDGVETQSAHLLTDVQEEAADEVDDGLYLCYCQTGEDWWTLAKEYRVPQEKLRRLNPDLPDALKAGTGVVVWKKSQ